jgi:hypothetical protein
MADRRTVVGVPSKRIRLCMRDLYHQDVVEMVERETRQFQMWEISSIPDDPSFRAAYDALWSAFGPHGRWSARTRSGGYMRDDPFEPVPSGTFVRYFLLAAKDSQGNLLGVRDGSVLVNSREDPGFVCGVPVAHLHVSRGARHGVVVLAAHRARRGRRSIPGRSPRARDASSSRRRTPPAATSA